MPIGDADEHQVEEGHAHFESQSFHEIAQGHHAVGEGDEVESAFIREQELVQTLVKGIEHGVGVDAQALGDLGERRAQGGHGGQRGQQEIDDDRDQPDSGQEDGAVQPIEVGEEHILSLIHI